jgi:hypothetical protein
MASRHRIEEKIEKKEQEIQELEMKLREAKAYIQALQDVMKMMPREGGEPASGQIGDSPMRAGSYVSDARDAIMKAGRPLHVVEILKASGRPNDRKNRTGMAGSLAAYIRRQEIFTRPRPNTFGLIELGTPQPPESPSSPSSPPPSARSSPPDDFGLDEAEEETAH